MYDLGGVAESTHSAYRRFDRFWKARMDVLNDSYIGKYIKLVPVTQKENEHLVDIVFYSIVIL